MLTRKGVIFIKTLHVSLILCAFGLFSDEKCQNVKKSRIQARNYKNDSNKKQCTLCLQDDVCA
jgi:hypothetical protein